jgi:hypothetical protein
MDLEGNDEGMLELIFLFLPGNIDKSTEYLCKI